ncbi:MAG TPA: hypothetical protein VMT30_02140 [Candidatus Saccharimonadia bacterium]|nr:hypothetical protein [Candidatus Saccharimonadia bacterium]
MKHARPDYDRIQDPAGLIPDDEPVFLVRGSDAVAARTVRFWANEAEAKGAAPNIVEAARRQAELMDAWPIHKVPDMPA